MAGRAVLRLVLTALAVGNMHVDALYPNGTAFACLPAPNNGTWCEIDVGATDPRLHATITPGTRYVGSPPPHHPTPRGASPAARRLHGRCGQRAGDNEPRAALVGRAAVVRSTRLHDHSFLFFCQDE